MRKVVLYTLTSLDGAVEDPRRYFPDSNATVASPPVFDPVLAGPVADVVRDLKARPGGDIGVHGSITLAQSLLAAGLVDELQLAVGPVLDPQGRRLFEHLDDLRRTGTPQCYPHSERQRLAHLPGAVTAP